MRRRRVLALCVIGLARCAPTAEQQAAALAPSGPAELIRARQSRRFDTADQAFMLRAVVATLQDLGYSIGETQSAYGLIVGTKLAHAVISVEVMVQPVPGQKAVIVRATFQKSEPRIGARLAGGEEMDDAALYQAFFEKLAQSAFLTAHGI